MCTCILVLTLITYDKWIDLYGVPTVKLNVMIRLELKEEPSIFIKSYSGLYLKTKVLLSKLNIWSWMF